MKPYTRLTLRSNNKKTGPIPVSTTEEGTCPSSCPLRKNGCYADSMPLAGRWQEVTDRRAGGPWKAFLAQIRALPAGALWRHNQAGDLPGYRNRIDGPALRELVAANAGKRGFTYTHKPPHGANALAIAHANANGFTVNLSADNLHEADELADLHIGPVVTLLPENQTENCATPAGRKVVVCPAITHTNTTCQTCQLCQRADRPTIVGFPAHGQGKRKASAIAEEELT